MMLGELLTDYATLIDYEAEYDHPPHTFAYARSSDRVDLLAVMLKHQIAILWKVKHENEVQTTNWARDAVKRMCGHLLPVNAVETKDIKSDMTEVGLVGW